MRNDLLRAMAGQPVEATPVMGDAEKTAIIGTPPGGYGDSDWDDEDDDAARKRRRNRIIAAVIAGVLVLGGVIAVALLIGPDGEEAPAASPTATQVSVPNVAGQDQATATQNLEAAGLTVGAVTTQVTSDESQVDTVLVTDPSSGTQVEQGSTVDLVIGVGPDTVEVPAVIGLDVDRAEATLANAGFDDVQTEEVDSLSPADQVTDVTPGEGQSVDPSTTVTLQVSDGTAAVPDVAGQQQAAATQALRSAGFTNVTPEQVESDQPEGTVVATDPSGGEQAAADEPITLQVSSGPAEPETVTVPDVVGQRQATAQAQLQAAGFSVDIREVPAGDEADVGVVLSTSPAGGSEADPGSTVTMTVGAAPQTTPGGGAAPPA
jgi:serine/threonine-protein kinase